MNARLSDCCLIDWTVDIVVGVGGLISARGDVIVTSVAMVCSEYIAEAPNAAEALGCAWASATLDGATAATADGKAGGVAAGTTASEFASPEPPEELFLRS